MLGAHSFCWSCHVVAQLSEILDQYLSFSWLKTGGFVRNTGELTNHVCVVYRALFIMTEAFSAAAKFYFFRMGSIGGTTFIDIHQNVRLDL